MSLRPLSISLKVVSEQGEKVKISGFGNFVVNTKRPRKGRNPQTGDEIIIVGRKVLTFKASQILKKSLNGMSSDGNLHPSSQLRIGMTQCLPVCRTKSISRSEK